MPLSIEELKARLAELKLRVEVFFLDTDPTVAKNNFITIIAETIVPSSLPPGNGRKRPNASRDAIRFVANVKNENRLVHTI
jgi:hypothetical protein